MAPNAKNHKRIPSTRSLAEQVPQVDATETSTSEDDRHVWFNDNQTRVIVFERVAQEEIPLVWYDALEMMAFKERWVINPRKKLLLMRQQQQQQQRQKSHPTWRRAKPHLMRLGFLLWILLFFVAVSAYTKNQELLTRNNRSPIHTYISRRPRMLTIVMAEKRKAAALKMARSISTDPTLSKSTSSAASAEESNATDYPSLQQWISFSRTFGAGSKSTTSTGRMSQGAHDSDTRNNNPLQRVWQRYISYQRDHSHTMAVVPDIHHKLDLYADASLRMLLTRLDSEM